jgi:hypothetical protein
MRLIEAKNAGRSLGLATSVAICPARPIRLARESDMTPEERQMLAELFERVKPAGATPRDAEAEAFINDAVRAAPFAPYVLSQTVLVQQQALEGAARRITELEAATRQSAEQSQEHGSFLGNLGKTIFGGGAPVAPPRPSYDDSAYQRGPAPGPAYAPPPPQGYPAPPPPSYPAPPAQPQAYGAPSGPWGAPPQPRGGGFLQNAASTAAGVAGGVALGNLLGGLFGGHAGGGGLFGGSGVAGAGLLGGGVAGGAPEVTETVNNFYEGAPDNRQDADMQQFDPGSRGVQDANFDQPDDSTFDGSDDSSFDGGGGYDDV